MDRVQKHKSISKEGVKYLRKLGIIEGKMPNIYLSSSVAESLDKKEEYVKNKGFDDEAYQKWIISYLTTYRVAKKQDIIKLLNDKLPNSLNNKQKEDRVKNILRRMRTNNIIELEHGNKRLGNWILKKKVTQ